MKFMKKSEKKENASISIHLILKQEGILRNFVVLYAELK